MDKKYLGKIIQLAKRGEGGEKENAIRIVHKLCEKHNLNFDDVMSSVDKQEYYIECKKTETELLAGIIYRYAFLTFDDDIGANYNSTRLFFTTTPDKFIETQCAFDILRIKFKEEKKLADLAFTKAFKTKNNLYYQPTDEEWIKIEKERKGKIETEEQKKIKLMAEGLTYGMDRVNIYKQIK